MFVTARFLRTSLLTASASRLPVPPNQGPDTEEPLRSTGASEGRRRSQIITSRRGREIWEILGWEDLYEVSASASLHLVSRFSSWVLVSHVVVFSFCEVVRRFSRGFNIVSSELSIVVCFSYERFPVFAFCFLGFVRCGFLLGKHLHLRLSVSGLPGLSHHGCQLPPYSWASHFSSDVGSDMVRTRCRVDMPKMASW